MSILRLSLGACLLQIFASAARAETAHPFLCCDNAGNKVCVVSREGKIEWEYPCQHPQDCWRLANGNYLFCFQTGALEVKPDKQIAWQYKAPEKTEVHACQPLPDGKVMLVECGASRIIEVDRDGKLAKEIKLTTLPSIHVHDQFRGTRKTKEGHYLVCFKGEHKVVEFDNDGKILRKSKCQAIAMKCCHWTMVTCSSPVAMVTKWLNSTKMKKWCGN